jgi:copper resistance protein C
VTSGFGGGGRGSGGFGDDRSACAESGRRAAARARAIDRAPVQFAPVTHPTRARNLASLIAGALLVAMLPAVVLAHAELDTSAPADGSTVESSFDGPIVLDFTEALASGSEADLLGPDGAVVATADVDGPGARMTFEFDAPLDPGDYEVRWTGIALDGHVDRGTFGFTVAPAAPTPEPTPEATPTPEASASAAPATSAPASAEPSEAPSPSSSPDNGTATGTGDVLLPIIVALIVVGVGAVYLLTRRNRPSQPG